MTNCQSVVLVLLTASFLTACTPTTNNNNYGPGKAGMSGGGATKDPGNGTGGGDSGGGGQGVRCGETKSPDLKNKLFVRDIYESIYNQNRKMKSVANDAAGASTVSIEAIKVLTDSLKAHYGPASHNLEFTEDKFWTEFAQKISFLDEERRLVPSQDANSPIVLPNECQIVQIAYWDESPGRSEEGTLFVNKQLWTELTQINKIALLAHEYFYKQARKALFKNSDTVRNKIGELLSVEGISPLFKNWDPAVEPASSKILPKSKNGFKFCQGTSEEDPSAKIHFYQYEGSDKKQHFVVPFLTSNSISSSFLKNTDFYFDPEKNKDLSRATDLLIYQSTLKGDNQLLDSDGSEELGDRSNNWFPRWFADRGFLNFELNEGTKNSIIVALSELAQNKEIVWSDFLTSSLHPIKVSLVNPASDKLFDKDIKIKSKDELIGAAQGMITTYLNKCSVPWPESDTWIAVLRKEISDNISAGTHPKKFEKWITLLRTLDTSNCERENSNLYSETLPSLLYSLNINTYDARMVAFLMEAKGFEVPEWNYLNPGRIRVTQDTSTLNFNLDCDDYESTFFKISDTKNPEPTTVRPNKKVAKFMDNKTENSEETDTIRTQSLDRLVNYLKYQDGQAPINSGGDQYVNTIDFNCQSNFSFMNLPCAHFVKFSSDLSQETELNVTSCRVEHTTWKATQNSKQTPEVCAIIDMKSTNRSYKVYFSFSLDKDLESQGPSFGFVRLLGNILKKDKWGDPIE